MNEQIQLRSILSELLSLRETYLHLRETHQHSLTKLSDSELKTKKLSLKIQKYRQQTTELRLGFESILAEKQAEIDLLTSKLPSESPPIPIESFWDQLKLIEEIQESSAHLLDENSAILSRISDF